MIPDLLMMITPGFDRSKLKTVSSTTTTPPLGLYAADRAVNQCGTIMISQSIMEMMMMSNIQSAMTGVDNGNTDDYDIMTVTKSADHELRGEVTTAGMPVETTTYGGEILMS